MTWIISGQSNAAGYAVGNPAPAIPDVLAWDPKSRAWQPARDPLPFVRVPDGETLVGPWHAAALTVVRSGRVRSIKLTGAAGGGLAIDSWATDGPLWVELESAIAQSGHGARVFIWFQGESDAMRGGAMVDSYASKLTDLIRRVRQASANPRMLVIVCGLVDYPQAEAAFEAIRNAHRAVVARDPRSAYVSTHGLPREGQHLTQRGSRELARKVAGVVLSLGDLTERHPEFDRIR